jgi:hypothetical protein
MQTPEGLFASLPIATGVANATNPAPVFPVSLTLLKHHGRRIPTIPSSATFSFSTSTFLGGSWAHVCNQRPQSWRRSEQAPHGLAAIKPTSTAQDCTQLSPICKKPKKFQSTCSTPVKQRAPSKAVNKNFVPKHHKNKFISKRRKQQFLANKKFVPCCEG